jgi:Fe-S oxidoreductase
VNIKHVVEVLPGAIPANLSLRGSIYLHHPCPSYRFDFIRESARRLCGDREIDEQGSPQCCGQGGSLPALSPESASMCTSKIFRASSEATLVTYCMGCKDQFLREGKQAHHLLELMVSARPVDRPLSSVRKWWNRFVLRLKAGIGKGAL